MCLKKINGFKGKSSQEGVIYLGNPDRSGWLLKALTSGWKRNFLMSKEFYFFLNLRRNKAIVGPQAELSKL